ncbi:hypothetical protein HB364_30920 [Pseudoflavitalea sp. X16]|uniref:hypothetical protein n=1 Tax=Paraflavitalea devenefica TaxID=2716334 RepID=UPI00141F2ED2|nr:hypothetical protein [Paraflavitalea devenefica]NII29533.1 hypothetical protein [Paraflavitalea devenefica]
MDIVNHAATGQLRSDLSLVLRENEKNISHKIEQVLSEADHWKFATDEFYCPVPYHNELNKLKKGRLLKNINESDRFSKQNLFSFGFDRSDQLRLMQNMIGKEVRLGVNTKLYEYGPSDETTYYVARHYPGKDFPDKLISTGRFKKLDEATKIDMVVGSDGNWSVTYYTYDPGTDRIIKATRYALGWNGQTEYDFVYEHADLSRIMVGEVVWWKSK